MFRRRPKSPERPIEKDVYPFDVRFALGNRQGQFRRNDVEALIRNGFSRLGFYLSMKAADSNDAVQAGLIHRVASKELDIANLEKINVSKALDLLGTKTVDGNKLASVSRHGPNEWVKKIDRSIESVSGPNRPVFMLASAPFAALDLIMEHTIDKGNQLGILKPDRFDRSGLSPGFMLTPAMGGVELEMLRPDFIRPENAVIFDDHKKHGTVMADTINYWNSQAGAPAPMEAVAIDLSSLYQHQQ